jgi:MFS family permease
VIPTTAYKRYVLVVLTAVYMLNLVDRGLMTLLLEDIKADLGLTDTQLGALTGVAFGVFYATVGLPIARWADRGNRVTISALAIGMWGLTAMACVAVGSYAQLVLARIAAGVGESGCKPPTYSLVGDYFPSAAERAPALAFYLGGSSVASLLSYMAGGWLNEQYGWRLAFFMMGVPALLLAVLVKWTIVEPRTHQARASGPRPQPMPFAKVLATLGRQRSLRYLSAGLVLLYTFGAGLSPWYAAFMVRSHGASSADLGMWFGLIFGFGGLAGVLAGGYLASGAFAYDERSQMRMCAVTLACVLPFFVAFLLLPEKWQALLALVPLVMIFSVFMGPTYALLQRLVPDEMRATTMALIMLFANLIGMGLGPQIVGILSDVLAPVFARDSLRYAMLMVSFLALLAGYCFWRAGDTVREDLADQDRSRSGGAPRDRRKT